MGIKSADELRSMLESAHYSTDPEEREFIVLETMAEALIVIVQELRARSMK